MIKDHHIRKYKYYHKILGIILIFTGIILYPTPIPGTTFMILLGFVFFIGKKKTVEFFRHILSHKAFRFLKINKIVNKI